MFGDRVSRALVDRYAGIGLDVDGVLVRAGEVVPGAAEALDGLRARAIPFALLTNNSTRTPGEVAAHLGESGIAVDPGDVVTSSTVAVRLIAPGTRCLVIGEGGLRAALAERGAEVVTEPAAAQAVVVGWDRELRWDDLRRATLALDLGARFVGTNDDPFYPAPEGPWPGNGAALAALVTATGRTPDLAGKPHKAMFDEARRRLAAAGADGRLLMVGDSHRTDITGGAAAGWDTALVLSGATSHADLGDLDPAPTFILDGPADLLRPPPTL